MSELRNTNHYADLVAARYPLLDPKAVRRVCRYLMRNLAVLAVEGEDVLLQSARYAVTLKVYTPDPDARRHNLENAGRRMERAVLRRRRAFWYGTGAHTRKTKLPLKSIR